MISFRIITHEFVLITITAAFISKKGGNFFERVGINLTEEETHILVKMLRDGGFPNVSVVKSTIKGRPVTSLQCFLTKV
jgi:hypothetical protein